MTDARSQPSGRLAQRFFQAAVTGNAFAASTIVAEAVHGDLGLTRVYQDVLTPALDRVGQHWATGRLTVAEEHLATQITLDQMGRLRQVMRPFRNLGLSAVVAAIEGEQHTVGARMVADLLTEAGWSVAFLGASTPVSDLVAYVAARPVDLVVVSVTMAERVTAVGQVCQGLRALARPPKVVVGGKATADESAQLLDLGADYVAHDAADAVQAARGLIAGPSGPNPPLDQILIAVGRNVLDWRTRRGLSQQALATKANLDRTYISAVERGRQNLTIGALLSLAQALDVPLSDVLAVDADRG